MPSWKNSLAFRPIALPRQWQTHTFPAACVLFSWDTTMLGVSTYISHASERCLYAQAAAHCALPAGVNRKVIHEALQDKAAAKYEPIQLKESRATIVAVEKHRNSFQSQFGRYAASVIMTVSREYGKAGEEGDEDEYNMFRSILLTTGAPHFT
jgi:hypothetical protein